MKKLLIYLKNYKKETVLAPLFKMLEACFELIVPLVVATIIDKGIKFNNTSVILTNCGVLVLLAVVGMVAAISAQYFAAKAATGFSTQLRYSLFEKINTFSFSEIDSIGTSTLITRLTNDVNQLQNGVNLVLRLFLRSPIVVVGAMIMAVAINFKAGLIFVLVIALLSVVIFIIMKVTVPMYKNVQQTLDGVTLSTRENLAGARVIRAFCEENNEYNKFSDKNNLLAKLQRAVGRISALLNPLTYVIINLGIVFLVYYGALKVDSGTLSQGMVVALYNYMGQILVELIKFANLIVTVTKAFASGTRVNAVFDMQNTLEFVEDNKKYDDCAVSFYDVSLNYKGAGEESLSDITFTADKGQIIGVIGSTGSGKTSLVNLIAHFYDCTKGVVAVNGKNVKSYNEDDLRSKIGFVMQKSVLFNATVRENIKWGNNDATDEQIDEALRLAQIYDTIYQKQGLDTVINQNGSNLSGGQKQRLSIARALVGKPEILVFDDSSSALDFATEKKLLQAIFSLDYNPTVFVVTQRCSSVLSADKIIVLDNGCCVGIGNNQQLLETNDVYKEIYYSQFEKEEIV